MKETEKEELVTYATRFYRVEATVYYEEVEVNGVFPLRRTRLTTIKRRIPRGVEKERSKSRSSVHHWIAAQERAQYHSR